MSVTPPTNPTNSTPSLQWRVELIKPTLPSRRMGSLHPWGVPAVLLLALFAMLGSTVGLISTLQPLPQPRLVALWMSKPVDLRTLHAPTIRDVDALMGSGIFAPTGIANQAANREGFTPASFDQQISLLAGLQGDEPVIVYLSAVATVDASQQVMLLSGSPLDRALESQRPLTELLQTLQHCRASHKLLILELGWPNDGTDIMQELQAQLQGLPSPSYSIICTSSPGETARTIVEPRQSLFAYFLEQGLLGNADGFLDQRSDGRVSTPELVAYVKQTVKSYSQEVYAAQQTPMVIGNLATFDLCAYSAAKRAQSDAAVAQRTPPPSSALPASTPAPAEVAATPSPRELRETAESAVGETQRVAASRSNIPPEGQPGRDNTLSIDQVNSAANPSEFPHWLQAAWQARDRMIAAKYYHFARPRIVLLENEIFSAELAWRDGMPVEPLQACLDRSAKDLEAWAARMRARYRGPVARVERPRANIAGKPSLSDGNVASSPQGAVSPQTTPLAPTASIANLPNASELQASLARFMRDALSLRAATPRLSQGTLAAAGTVSSTSTGEQASAALAALVEEFKKAHADVSAEELTRDLFQYVRDHSQFQTNQLAYVNLILPTTASGPLELKEQLLRSLVQAVDRSWGQTLTKETIQGLLKVVSLNEQRTDLPQIWPWLAEMQTTCDLNRAAMEQSLWTAEATGMVPMSRFLEMIKAEQKLTTIRQRLESAYDAVTYNRLRLQQCSPVDESVHRIQQWCNSADQSEQLEQMLLHPNAVDTVSVAHRLTATKQINYLHAETVQLQLTMDRFLGNASGQHIKHLLSESQVLEADAGHLLDLQRLLGTSLPTAEQRVLLHAASHSLAKKIHYQALQRMQSLPAYATAATSSSVDSGGAARTKLTSPIGCARKLQARLATEQPPLSDWDSHLGEIWSRSERLYSSLAQSNPKIDYYASTAQLYRLETQSGPAPRVGMQAGLPTVDRGHFIATRERESQPVVTPRIKNAAPKASVAVDWLPTTAPSATPVASIRLRTLPGHQAYAMRLTNISPQPKTVIVELSNGAEKLTSNSIPLEPGQGLPVTFAGQPPKPEDALPELTSMPSVRVLDATTRQLLLEQTVAVAIATPREYVEVLSATFYPHSIGRNHLEIWLRATQPLTAGPCVAKLSLEPAKINGLVSVTSGKLETELDPTGQPTRLLAEGLVFMEDTDNAGIFEISIDGVARAFRFHCNFTRVGQPTVPSLLSRPTLELLAPPTGRTGSELPVHLQVDNAPRHATLELRLKADQHFPVEIDRSYVFPSPQHHRLGFVASTGGELLFTAELNDWLVTLNTSHIVGARQLMAELASEAGVLAEKKQPLALDNRPPQYLQFVQFPERATVGSTQRVRLAAESPLTGIDSIQLFAGSLVDGKIPAGAPLIDCHCDESSKSHPPSAIYHQSLWSAELTWPQQLGDFNVTAIATNGAGLQTLCSVKLTAVTAAELNFGAIRGEVQEGGTPQPELDVLLINSTGQRVAKVKSRVDGTFEFAAVAAGEYLLFADKPTSRRSAQQQVRVMAGEISPGNLALRLAR